MLRITQHISRLLLEHDCVIVPGLGGFVGNYQPAKIHPTSYIFNSPSKSIAFNVNLRNNDGLLLSSIIEEEKLSLQSAESELKSFVAQIQDALRDHKPVKLPGIGRLTVDIENNLQFIPDNSQNYLPDSYGLYTFVAQPVLREKETAIRHIETIKIKPQKKRKSFGEVLLPVAAVLLLVLITVQIYIQSTIEGYNYAEIFGLDKVFSKDEFILDRYKPVESQINPSILNYRTVDTMHTRPINLTPQELIQPPLNKEPLVSKKDQDHTNYLLIAGALNEVASAQQIVDRLKLKGYAGYVLEKNGYQMVAINIPDSLSIKTYRELFIEDTGIDDAWVMRNK